MKVQLSSDKQIQIFNSQFWKESSDSISSELPIEKVAKRLKSLFSSPLDLSDDYYFSSLVDCTGKIKGNSINIQFVKYGRGNIRYDLNGQILNNPSGGSEIELKICGRNLLWGYIGMGLTGLFLPVVIGSNLSISWFIILFGGICLSAVLTLIYLAVDIGKRKSVLNTICKVIQKNISSPNKFETV